MKGFVVFLQKDPCGVLCLPHFALPLCCMYMGGFKQAIFRLPLVDIDSRTV